MLLRNYNSKAMCPEIDPFATHLSLLNVENYGLAGCTLERAYKL